MIPIWATKLSKYPYFSLKIFYGNISFYFIYLHYFKITSVISFQWRENWRSEKTSSVIPRWPWKQRSLHLKEAEVTSRHCSSFGMRKTKVGDGLYNGQFIATLPTLQCSSPTQKLVKKLSKNEGFGFNHRYRQWWVEY